MNLTNPDRRTPWNITQLALELHRDLEQCQNAFERSNCTGIYTAEMRGLRDQIKASGRRFTPGECAVMQQLGISFEQSAA